MTPYQTTGIVASRLNERSHHENKKSKFVLVLFCFDYFVREQMTVIRDVTQAKAGVTKAVRTPQQWRLSLLLSCSG